MSHLARFALAATALAVIGSPALARDGGAAKTAVHVEGKGADKKYCITNSVTGKEQITGSMLSKKQCLTTEQWRKKRVELEAR